MSGGSRSGFFDEIYRGAGGDPAAVPWADLKPKDKLVHWLDSHPGGGRAAIDIACGLGDNAEALAQAGWRVTAFDLAADAIRWAQERFPASDVDYRVADLLAPPGEWIGAFELVHECYTLQSVSPDLLPQMRRAVAQLLAPGGALLVYARIRADGAPADGPPWPLEESEANAFAGLGLELVSREDFTTRRHDRSVPHGFFEWRRPR